MLGRKIENPVVAKAKRHILENTNPEGFIKLDKLLEIRNRAARKRALLELGYVAAYEDRTKLLGYTLPNYGQ